MSWSVEQIISTFRDLTGRKSTNQIPDADILAAVNHYYQYVFPLEINITEFKGWYTFNTADGIGFQDLPETVLSVAPPVYSNDDAATLWTDEERFYAEYPHDYTTEDIPTDILLFDRTLILRPIPDDIYEVRLRQTSSIPDALTSGALDNSLFGPAIAYGTSVMFLADKGEKDIADEHADVYQYHLGLVRTYIIRQNPPGKRPRGGRF